VASGRNTGKGQGDAASHRWYRCRAAKAGFPAATFGTKIDTTYTATFDGKPVTISGSGLPYDTVAVTQVNANTTKDVRSKNGGKYKGTGEFKVSKHGKTATLTTKGTNAEGKPFNGLSVYDKQ